MKAFADQGKSKPIFRRHAPAAGVYQGNRARCSQRGQIRQILDSPRPQAKLTIGAPDDVYEQEADPVADEAMRMPDPAVGEQRVQRMCPECEEELQPAEDQDEDILQRQTSGNELDEEEELQPKLVPGSSAFGEPLQRQVDEEADEELVGAKEIPGQTPVVSPEVERRINSVRSGGQPLPESERQFFEPRFGRDFSDVRIHTNGDAAEAAQAMNARAFTVGNAVVFGSGEYANGTHPGQRLLAHELAHVVQQHGAGESTDINPETLMPPVQRYEAGEHAQFGATSEPRERRIGFYGFALDWPDWKSLGADKSFDSMDDSEAMEDLEKEFYLSHDNTADPKDGLPIDLRVVGYSYGGWTALQLAEELDNRHPGTFKVSMGLVDPINTLRLGAKKAPNIVKSINYYQTLGCSEDCPLKGWSSWIPLSWAFRSQKIAGFDNNEVGKNEGLDEKNAHIAICPGYCKKIADEIFK